MQTPNREVELPSITFHRRRVKHLRLHVYPDCTITCIVPLFASEREVQSFISVNTEWIAKQLRKFGKLAIHKPTLQENHILFLGEIYTVHLQEGSTRKQPSIDSVSKTILSTRNLLQPTEATAWYKKQAQKIIPQRVAHFAQLFGFTYGTVSVRSQKSKWGSCSARGNLNFNYKLVKAPPYVLDYLVIHELVHTEHLNHSPQYWNRVAQCMPNYQIAEDYLKKEGRWL